MNKVVKIFLFSLGICFLFSLSSHIVLADTGYTPLAPIPGYVEGPVQTNSLNDYLNNMFKLGIAVAGALAVVMIILGGIQYMSTDAIGKKEEGKKRIAAAVTGLVVALGSYMLLNTLSADFLSTKLTLDERLDTRRLATENGDGNPAHNRDQIVRAYDDPDGTQHVIYKNGDTKDRYVDGSDEIKDRTGKHIEENGTPINVPPPPTGDHPQAPGGVNLNCDQLQPAINETIAGLKAAGITNENDIAAILGHVRQESSFNGLENDTSDHNGGAQGMFQVSTALWNQYSTWAQANGYAQGSQYAQAYFMANRFKQNQPGLYSQFINAQSPKEALDIWGTRPGTNGSKNGWNYWGTTGDRYVYADQFKNGGCRN